MTAWVLFMPDVLLAANWFWIPVSFVFGLLIGSFLNVVGLRLLTDESIVFPGSHCPHCKTPLSWYENIPVLSYLFLRGQCRHCNTPISLQYPLIELLTATLFALTVSYFGPNAVSLFLLILVAQCVVMTITDLKESLIFHVNSLGLIPVGLLLHGLMALGWIPSLKLTLTTRTLDLFGWTIPPDLVSVLVGVVGIFLLFEGMIWLSKLVFGTEGFGHGDTFLLMGVASFIGWELTAMSLLLGFGFQAVFAIPMLFVQWVKAKQTTIIQFAIGCFGLAVLPYILASMGLPALLLLGLTLLCGLGAVVLLTKLLKHLKAQNSFTYMPLGPALIAASLLALFTGQMWPQLLQTWWLSH